MNKFISAVNGIFFIILITIGGSIFWALPKQTISNDENRKLIEFPELNINTVFSGSFEKAFEEYYNDHFPFRDTWMNFASHLQALKGNQEQEIRVINLNSHPIEDTTESNLEDEKEDSVEEQAKNSVQDMSQPLQLEQKHEEIYIKPETEISTQKAKEDTDTHQTSLEEEFSKVKGVVIVNGRVLQVFAGSKHTILPYANLLNEYRKKLPTDTKIYTMMIPSGSDFYLPYQVNKGVLKEKENIEVFEQLLSPEIISIPAYTEITPHKDQYIQFRTDHHWTGLGAYYAYIAFAKKAGFTPLNLNEMQFVRKEKTFLGSLYNYTKDAQLKKNPDILEYYKVPTEPTVTVFTKQQTSFKGQLYSEKNNSYLVFLGGDFPLVHIQNNKVESRSLLVIKDSFGNALIPYLTSHYRDIYVVDYRYFKNSIPKLIKKYAIKELLYAHNTFAANSKAASKFGEIMLNSK